MQNQRQQRKEYAEKHQNMVNRLFNSNSSNQNTFVNKYNIQMLKRMSDKL